MGPSSFLALGPRGRVRSLDGFERSSSAATNVRRTPRRGEPPWRRIIPPSPPNSKGSTQVGPSSFLAPGPRGRVRSLGGFERSSSAATNVRRTPRRGEPPWRRIIPPSPPNKTKGPVERQAFLFYPVTNQSKSTSLNSTEARGLAGLWVTDEQITQVNKRLAMPSSFALVFSQPGIT